MRRFTLLTIVGLFALIAGAAVYQVLLVQGKPRNAPGPGVAAVQVPDVIGMTTTEAARAIEERDFRYRVRPVGPREGTPDQTVISQDPPAGRYVAEGSVLQLEAACHPAPCPTEAGGSAIVDPCTCATAG